MRITKTKAIDLRLKGKSYSEISKSLNVPKSTLSGWLSDIVLSDEARKIIATRTNKKSFTLLLRRNRLQTIRAKGRADNIRKRASEEIGKLGETKLFYVGIALYWAEGHKRLMKRNGRLITSHPISLTNSDPALIRVFIKFLNKFCDVPIGKIKASLRLYKHLDEKEMIDFWSKKTGISIENFGKTYYGISKSSSHKRPIDQLPFGTIQIRVSDTALFYRILGWIDALKNQ